MGLASFNRMRREAQEQKLAEQKKPATSKKKAALKAARKPSTAK